jgi:hypothetical protein
VLTLGCQVSSLCGFNMGVIFDSTKYKMRYLCFARAKEKKDQISRSIERQATQKEQFLRLCVIYDAAQGRFELIYVVLCRRMDERWKRGKMGESSVQAPLCLRRLIIARAVSPTTIPAMMDSHGKPGIPGSATGVVIAVEDDA